MPVGEAFETLLKLCQDIPWCSVLPGCIIEIHLTLVQNDEIAEGLRDMITGLKITGNKAIDDWKMQHCLDWTENTLPVLHLAVSTGAHKFSNNENQVETIAIHIESAEADTMYLKFLFAETYEKDEL
eukprot:12832115-Ditylum_brightwellii.AAC.1